MSDLHRGLVVSVGKNSAWVVLDDETAPRLAGLRRASGTRTMPVPGDEVHVRMRGDGTTVVDRLEPRRFSLERRTVGGRRKTMAANVDAIVTVTALAQPSPRLPTLDQLLAFASIDAVVALVVLTKPDLAPPQLRGDLERLYGALGYAVVTINPKHDENMEALREALRGRHALLCGNSGVGKSTIFRALGGPSTVGEVSRHGMGRQTTTAAHLFRLGEGFLIDSPGVNEFGLGAVSPPELTAAFVEFPAAAAGCRFADCTHLREPDCGVQAGVAAGTIARSRYDSYRRILLDPI